MHEENFFLIIVIFILLADKSIVAMDGEIPHPSSLNTQQRVRDNRRADRVRVSQLGQRSPSRCREKALSHQARVREELNSFMPLLEEPPVIVSARINDQPYPSENTFLHAAVLHAAINVENDFTVKRLLRVPGININLTNQDGHTPLHLAVLYGSLMLVRLLLDSPHIDTTIHDVAGNCPLKLAIRCEQQLIVYELTNFHQKSAEEVKQSPPDVFIEVPINTEQAQRDLEQVPQESSTQCSCCALS